MITDKEIESLKQRAIKYKAGLENYHVMAAPYVARIEAEIAVREESLEAMKQARVILQHLVNHKPNGHILDRAIASCEELAKKVSE
jgi:hypothetical protein